jgi:hypothetical protein
MILLLACYLRPPIQGWDAPASGIPAGHPGLSDKVQALVQQYPKDGSYGFYWPPDDGIWWGTTRDLWYQGMLLSPCDPEHRSHCVGLTWEVAMQVLQEEAGEGEPIHGLSQEQIQEFRTDWFVRELLGAGARDALEHFGGRVAIEDMQPGDFIQLWTRGRGGHSAVFQEWILQKKRRVGVRYWSTHPITDGIGIQEELFAESGIEEEYFFGARLYSKADWY